MTILITGGAGFLGKNLYLALRKKHPEELIVIVDSLLTGDEDNLNLSDDFLHFIQLDVLHLTTSKIKQEIGDFKTGNIREIYHLACPASPPKYQINPVHTLLTSVVGTHNVLKLAQDCHAKVLFTSTSEIYGDPEVSPQSEDYRGSVNSFGPRSCYDEGKRAAETLCYDFCHRHNVEVRIARIFNTYGPYMDLRDGRVVTSFIVQALKNEDITIYGDGCQTRSFCYVDDQIRGLMALMDSKVKSPVNIGNPHEITIRQLADKIIQMTNSKSQIKFLDLPEDDPTQRCPDIIKARKFLAWEPEVRIDVGLKNTIAYIKGVLRLKASINH